MVMNRILLIEDDLSVARCTERMLTSMGFEVIVADCGEAGLNALRHQPEGATLALIDYTLPRANGIEVFDQIRSEFPLISLVLMSGFPQSDFENDLSIRDSSGFLQKPFQRSDLKRVVENSFPIPLHQKN